MVNKVTGLEEKRNKEGHKVIRLHYSADPLKNPNTTEGAEWFKKETSKYVGGVSSLGWRREMEIDFGAGSGELVFPEFAEFEKEFTCDPFEIDEKYTLFGGFDWGTRNPVSFHVYAEAPDKRFYSVWEYYEERQAVPTVAQALRTCPYYNRIEWIAADPTIWSENLPKKDGFTSVASMLQDEEEVGEMYVIDKLMPAHDRSDVSCINKLKTLWLGKPPKIVFFRNCHKQISELKNLKYPERKENVNETEKILDKNNHCYSDDTEILTASGWRLFKDLTDTDSVAVWGENGNLAYEIPTERQAFDYAGDMHTYEKDINFCVTPNHKMWVANQMSVIRNNNPEYKRVTVTDLPQVSWVSTQTMSTAKDIEFPDSLIAWYGFWLAEGCKSQNYRGSYYAHVDQSLKKIDRELMRMLWKAGHYSRYYNKDGMVRFSYGKKFYELVANQGTAGEKFIPLWLKNASARQLKLLIKWMIRGDGTDNGKMFCYNTISKQLADDFQEICLKAGYVSSISSQKERVSVLPSGRTCLSKKIYRVSIRSGRSGQGGKGVPSTLSQIRKDQITVAPYKGKVYCVTTNSGVVYTRRKGKGMWCGQSWDDLKYFVLSHPFVKLFESKPQFGTVAYMNEAASLAAQIAERTGQSIQEVFNDQYGK